MYTGVLSHTHNFSRFSFEGFYTHITGEKKKKRVSHKEMHVYIVLSHDSSTFSCEGFYTHITQETLFTQENEFIKAFFHTVFHFY